MPLRAERLEDRTTPTITALFAAGTLTVTLDAPGDVAWLTSDGTGHVNVGTTAGAQDVFNGAEAVTTRIVLQDAGANVSQGAAFEGFTFLLPSEIGRAHG